MPVNSVRFGVFDPMDRVLIQQQRQALSKNPNQIQMADLSIQRRGRREKRDANDQLQLDYADVMAFYERFTARNQELIETADQYKPGELDEACRLNLAILETRLLKKIRAISIRDHLFSVHQGLTRLAAYLEEMPDYVVSDKIVEELLTLRGGLACADEETLKVLVSQRRGL